MALTISFIALLFFLGGFGFAKILSSNPEVTDQKKKELTELRKLRDELTHVAVDHVTTEPFAVIVLDIIRKSER